MAVFDEEALKKNIKSGEFSRVYFIYGNESYLKHFYIDLLIKKTVDNDFKDFNLHILEGKDTNLNEISDCVLSFPMMGEYSLTVVNDYPVQGLVGDRGKINVNFEELINELPESTVLVFFTDNTEVDEKNTKYSRFIKFIESKGGICANICKRNTTQLSRLLQDSAKKKGCDLSRDVALYMVSLAGDDMSILRNELDKVCAYRKSGAITKNDIDRCVIASVEAKVFSLSRQIASGDADGAFTTLSNLFKLKEEPVAILAVLSKAFVDMYRVKAVKEKGLKPDCLADIFPSSYKGRAFIITNAAKDGGRYGITQLRKALELLSEADLRLKSTGENPRSVLEELVLRLLRV